MKEYPIRIVSKITGLTSDQIRKWEERYPILKISRSERGSRRFTDKDLEILQLMLEAKRIGFTLQEIGNYKVEDLRSLVNELESTKSSVVYPELEQLTNSARPYFDSCVEALNEYNLRKMEKAIYDVALDLGAIYVIHKFMVPFIKHVGRLWKNNKISKSQERFANAVIRNYLENYRSSFKNYNPNNPFVLVATPKGQKAELGCLVNACLAVSTGWNPVYLGTDLSSRDICEAAKNSSCSAVIMSILFPLNDPTVPLELERIRNGLGGEFEIIINGKRSSIYSKTCSKIGSHQIYDLFSLPNALEDIRTDVLRKI
tara:strand:+ start:39 stop:983 length:945 start_codon:yes stop_codon:yes gene_type:complete